MSKKYIEAINIELGKLKVKFLYKIVQMHGTLEYTEIISNC